MLSYNAIVFVDYCVQVLDMNHVPKILEFLWCLG